MAQALFVHGSGDLRVGTCKTACPSEGEVQVALRRGGICGSDLHYFNHGGFGTVRLREPMILGHEVAGEITEIGPEVTGLAVGDLVAISPSRPCFTCVECRRGLPNQCLNMRFYGSAMPFPHIQGAFREVITVRAENCVKADGLSAAEAAMAEPLAVALHAVRRAGNLVGQSVLVTGCGPIGVLAIMAARRAGAGEIIATDISDTMLSYARKAGADVCLNTARNPEALSPYEEGKGTVDALFECSGAQVALVSALLAIRPQGRLVQLGMSGDMQLPMMQITSRELQLMGSFRFHEEFAMAVRMMQNGLIDTRPLITHSFAWAEFSAAFAMANDRTQAMKVQLEFGPC
ncbi:alcohol dehydrogenase catalytic domain-containing protein [Rhodobacterales bacterium HKCCD6035]|nr:alcohol dehydrogenase catalytic domain-containing protein [Rhodobacterales bacterium HKCCD6035]